MKIEILQNLIKDIYQEHQEITDKYEQLISAYWTVANILSNSYLGDLPDYETLAKARKDANRIIADSSILIEKEKNPANTEDINTYFSYIDFLTEQMKKAYSFENISLSEDTKKQMENLLFFIEKLCRYVYHSDCSGEISNICYKMGIKRHLYDNRYCKHCRKYFTPKAYNQEYCDECERKHFGKEIIEEE